MLFMMLRRCCVGAALIAGAGFFFGGARAAVSAGPPEQAVPGASEWREPESVEDAASMIRRRLKDIRACLESGAVAAVHSDAWDVARLARAVPALAQRGAGDPAPSDAAGLAKTSEELARRAEALHTLADSEKIDAAREQFTGVDESFHAFEALVPGTYACPMRCENDKVYPAPGQCPVCTMNLKRITNDEYTVSVNPAGGAIDAGKPAVLEFRLADPSGAPVGRLEVVHEQILHLLMVSEDLSWFAHEHPVRRADGVFELAFTFPHPGKYTLYCDFTPPKVGMQVVQAALEVPGDAPAKQPLIVDGSRTATVCGTSVMLTIPEPIETGVPTKLRYLLMDGNTPVKDLEPYLGTLGHLIIIKDDRTAFVHSHPKGKGHHASNLGGPTVLFEAYFKVPGRYKAWAQFKRAGEILTVPFVFDVKPGKVHAEESPD